MKKLTKEEKEELLSISKHIERIDSIMQYCPSYYGLRDTVLCEDYEGDSNNAICLACLIKAIKELSD